MNISNGQLWKYSSFIENKILREAFGDDVINSYLKLKRKEIEDFDQNDSFDKKSPVTSWEKNNTLDC